MAGAVFPIQRVRTSTHTFLHCCVCGILQAKQPDEAEIIEANQRVSELEEQLLAYAALEADLELLKDHEKVR